MSNFRKFAIVGAGKVGGFIVEELLKQKAAGSIDEITIVSRPVRSAAHPSPHSSITAQKLTSRPCLQASRDKDKNKSFAARGVRIASAEFTDVPALTAALAGTHVVISTISLFAIDAQVPIAEAAKAARASLFIPSEFGGPTDKIQGIFAAKGALHAKLREVGPPVLLVYTGPFADYSWEPYVLLIHSRRLGVDVRGGQDRQSGY